LTSGAIHQESHLMDYHLILVEFLVLDSLIKNDLFQWQHSFHDPILRNDKSYQDIFNSKNQNPERWIENTFNK
jgi:hypothetical protein